MEGKIARPVSLFWQTTSNRKPFQNETVEVNLGQGRAKVLRERGKVMTENGDLGSEKRVRTDVEYDYHRQIA